MDSSWPQHMEASRVLESMTDAFFALDGEWRFTCLNGEAEKLL
jgi:hypothetical protein